MKNIIANDVTSELLTKILNRPCKLVEIIDDEIIIYNTKVCYKGIYENRDINITLEKLNEYAEEE